MVAGTFTHGAISLVLCRMFSYATTISLAVVTLGNMWHFVGLCCWGGHPRPSLLHLWSDQLREAGMGRNPPALGTPLFWVMKPDDQSQGLWRQIQLYPLMPLCLQEWVWKFLSILHENLTFALYLVLQGTWYRKNDSYISALLLMIKMTRG